MELDSHLIGVVPVFALLCSTMAYAKPSVSVVGSALPDPKALSVEEMRCSAMPVNIRWPGHQRDLDQTEICHFARFDISRRGPTQVCVTPNRPFTNVVVRPLAKKVAVTREGDTVRFMLSSAGAYSVEFDGRHENLMLFADPSRAWKIDRTAPNVRYFGPGEHEVGVLRPKAGETIFLDEGAVVYGRIEACDADGLRICGRGILDASRVKEVPVAIDAKLIEEQRKKGWAITNVERFDAIRLMFCDDVRIEGITVRDSQIYAIRPVCCDRFTVDNVKILGSWRYNSDGIDMHNCRQVHIRDSFIRTYDDSICVKGFDYVLPEKEMLHEGVLHDVFEDVLVERCTIWNDWGRALEIGAETRAREIRNVTFRDCDILAVHEVALDVQNCDQAHVHDIVFEDIRVEYDPDAPKTVYSASAKNFDPASRRAPAALAGVVIPYIPEYSKAGAVNRGRTSRIAFRDIDVTAPSLPSGFCRGFDAEHRATDVTFTDIRLNGRDVTAAFVASVATNAYGEVRTPDAAAFDVTSLCPRPQHVSGTWAMRVMIDERLVARLACPDVAACDWFADHFAAAFGVRPKVAEAKDLSVAEDVPGAYAIRVTATGLSVAAREAAGVRHALFTLRQAAQRVRGGLKTMRFMLPLLEVKDAPAFPLRAMHLCWMPEMNPNRIEHLLRLAALYKFNVVVLEPWGTWRSTRHPWYGWKENPCNAESVKRLRAVAADLGVTLVPQINVFGHAGASRGDVGKHAVLDFAPEYAPLFEPRNGWNWCLSNPETRKVLTDLVTELHALFGKPPYFHLGCDEARKPSCPDCRTAPSYGRLVAEHVTELCNLVTRLGARPMLWHDMMLKRGDPRWEGFYANGTDETLKLLERLPRTAIICDWYYCAPHDDGEYPSYRHFKEQGFEVLACPWFGTKGIPPMGVAAKKAGIGGMMMTTWNYPHGMMLFNEFAMGATAAWRADGSGGAERDVFFDHFRLTGQDMNWKDYSETGVWDEQVPRTNAYQDGWDGRTFPQWVQ